MRNFHSFRKLGGRKKPNSVSMFVTCFILPAFAAKHNVEIVKSCPMFPHYIGLVPNESLVCEIYKLNPLRI